MDISLMGKFAQAFLKLIGNDKIVRPSDSDHFAVDRLSGHLIKGLRE